MGRQQSQEQKNKGKGRQMAFDNSESVAMELVLLADNDYELYKQQVEPIIKNLERKMSKGIFDSAKASKLVKYLMDNVAKKYTKRYGGTFTPDDRRLASKIWVEQFLANREVTV
jgi:hypothetical protein